MVIAADFIAQSLVDAGVRRVYGGHGGALVPLVNAVCDNKDLHWVCTRNEANASLMAAAATKLTGYCRLGCCIATSGPGASNLVTGLLDAQMDRVPMIAITGTKPRSDAAHSEFQDIDQSRLFSAGGLAYSVTVMDPLQLVAVMRDAVAIALTQRACVHVAVPVDIQGMEISAPSHLCSAQPEAIRARAAGARPNSEKLDAVVERLANKNERIVIAVGLDARHAVADPQECSNEILALAQLLHSPVVTRLDAKGAIDESHPLCMGVIGVHGKPGLANAASVIETSTLVLAFGVGDLHVLLCDQYGMQVRDLIEVALDGMAISTKFRAEQTLIANPILVCKQLTKGLQELGSRETWPARSVSFATPSETPEDRGMKLWKSLENGKWQDSVSQHRAHDGKRKRASSESAPGFCHPGMLIRSLTPLLKKEDVVCVDTGDITLWTSLCLQIKKGSTTLSSERLGTMGYALCAGIAASLERGKDGPGKAIVIAGDGGFQMTMNELGTAIQHNCNILIIVIDNGVLGRVEFGFKNAKGCDLKRDGKLLIDWVALAKSYEGADGVEVRSDEEIGPALEKGMASKGVFVLAAYTDPEVKAEMAKPSDAHHPAWLTAPQNKVDSG